MTDIKKLLGAKISRIRKEKGYSQIQFAEMLGLSTNALSIIETGNGFLTAETLEKILLKLELEPDELFSFGGIKSEEELYKNIIKNLETIKSDRAKLVIIDKMLKIII
ncbi:helix-turn-helix transcriptional regulator [Spirochaetes bacterium]|uniref:Helix-turn-helix transcriptional regulator n=1 Tax=Candidatus Scatousia excrementipullorum TaxID=2840936 RepID=A0A9D9DMP3_9BACT|nr:helix-turn-helix transcriptional regulator [Candidatus Scatousia excrementipullorum]